MEKREKDISSIRMVTWSGMAVNLALSMLKFIVGVVGSSQAVVADAVHSLSDMSTDLAVVVGVRYWSAPPDEDHPFGHRRIETLITLGIALVLGTVAVSLGYKALLTMRESHSSVPGWIAAVGPTISIVLKEILYRWTVAVGRRTRSPAVVANAWHHRSDSMSSIPALLAVVISQINPGWAFVDHVGAIIVSVFILKVAWDVGKPALSELSGRGANVLQRKRIEDIVLSIEGVRALHAVRTRKYGLAIMLDLHVLVAGELSVRKGHDIAENVKRRLIQQEPDIADVVVHVEPYDVS